MSEPKKKSVLGRGFDSLLPQNFDETLLIDAADRVEKIAVHLLRPNQYQPRQEFDESRITELADSIKVYGVLQPIIVTTVDSQEGYMIIAGERRWRASKLAGLKTIPAIVRTMRELEQLEIALIENVQRVDLSPLEQAASIEYLHDKFGTGYDEIAQRLGKGISTVSNIVRLLQLPDRAKNALREGKISEGHARAVLALKAFPEKQELLLNNVLLHNWTVRQAEQFVISIKEGAKDEKTSRERMRTETPATRMLSKRLNAPVFLRRTAKGGRLEVAFTSDEQLEAIIVLLS